MSRVRKFSGGILNVTATGTGSVLFLDSSGNIASDNSFFTYASSTHAISLISSTSVPLTLGTTNASGYVANFSNNSSTGFGLSIYINSNSSSMKSLVLLNSSLANTHLFYSNGDSSFIGTLFLLPQTASQIGISIKGAASYGANYLEFLNSSNTTLFSISQNIDISISNVARSSGNPVAFFFTGGSHTALNAGETVDVTWNLARTVQHSAGSYTNQRAFLIQAPTYSATSGSSTITNAATLAITGAPVQGANVVLTKTHAIWVQAGNSQFDGGLKTTTISATGVMLGPTGAVGAPSYSFTSYPTTGIYASNTATIGFAANNVLALSIDSATATFTGLLATKAGASTGSIAKIGGTVFAYIADAGNSTTVETDIYTDSIPASTLNVNKDSISGYYSGTMVNSATATRQLKVYFGGTVFFDSGALSLSAAATWSLRFNIIRVSATVVRCEAAMNLTGASTAAYDSYTEITGLTLSNANTLKITGTAAGVGAATNDIVAKHGVINWLSAP